MNTSAIWSALFFTTLLLTTLLLTSNCGRVGFDFLEIEADIADATAGCADETDCPAISSGVPIDVAGEANIHGAGHDVAPGPGGGGAGILPPHLVLPDGSARLIVLTNVTGLIDVSGGEGLNGPDGFPFSDLHQLSFGGLSGYWAQSGASLAAVFLDDTEPADPAPPDLDSGLLTYEKLSPLLNQVFVIGDGLTGTGSGNRQVITVPNGATRLFFGISDGSRNNELPGSYADNTGSFSLSAEFYVPGSL